jgi:hypothetical protein
MTEALEESCVPTFCEAYSADLRGTLVPYAPEVYLLAKIGGSRRVAAHFSKMLGKKISRKPVLTVLAKIQSGELKVSREEIIEAAAKHPIAQRFLARAPWLADPSSKKTVVAEPPPPAESPKIKRGRPTKPAPSGDEMRAGNSSEKEQNPAGNPHDKNLSSRENASQKPPIRRRPSPFPDEELARRRQLLRNIEDNYLTPEELAERDAKEAAQVG